MKSKIYTLIVSAIIIFAVAIALSFDLLEKEVISQEVAIFIIPFSFLSVATLVCVSAYLAFKNSKAEK